MQEIHLPNQQSFINSLPISAKISLVESAYNFNKKMSFDIRNKVAMVTGGASGLGFFFAKELLANGLRVSFDVSY